MNQLPIEILFEILIGLPYRDIINYGLADANIFYTICQSDSFWKSKYEHDFEPIPGLTVDEDWRTIYETRMKDLSFFSAYGEDYALIDNKGQLFVRDTIIKAGGCLPEQKLPKLVPFNEKFVYLSRYGNKIGLVTVNGKAYILDRENENRITDLTSEGKRVLKTKLMEVSDSDQFFFLLCFLVLDDYSVEYLVISEVYAELGSAESTFDKNQTEKLELSNPVKDIIHYSMEPLDEDEDIFDLKYYVLISTWNNKILNYRVDLIPNVDKSSASLNLTYLKTITLPNLPQQIFYDDPIHDRSNYDDTNYVILSKGQIFIYNHKTDHLSQVNLKIGNNEHSLRKINLNDKVPYLVVKSIDHTNFMYSIVTQTGDKLYLWKGPAARGIKISDIGSVNQLRAPAINERPYQDDRKDLIDRPLEINLSDESNDQYNIIASGFGLYNWIRPTDATKEHRLREYHGFSLTADGKILTWSVQND